MQARTAKPHGTSVAIAVAKKQRIMSAQDMVMNITPFCTFSIGFFILMAIDQTVNGSGRASRATEKAVPNIPRCQKIGTRQNAPKAAKASTANAVHGLVDC